MATIPVTITDKEGNVRVESGAGEVLSTSKKKDSTVTVTESSSGTATSVPVYIDEAGNRVAKTIETDLGTKTRTYTKRASEIPTKSSTPTKTTTTKQTLPEGAREVSGGRIAYKGAYYDKETFYQMQARGRELGIQDSPEKEQLVYKSKISDIISYEHGTYNPETGKITLFAPKGTEEFSLLSGIIEATPEGWKAEKVGEGQYIVVEQPLTEVRLSHFDIPVNEGYVYAPTENIVDLGPVVSTPLGGGSGGSGSREGAVRKTERFINEVVELIGTPLREGGEGLRNVAKTKLFPGDEIRGAIVGNTIYTFATLPEQAVKTSGTALYKIAEADYFNLKPDWAPASPFGSKYEARQVIQEDLFAVGAFAGHQALYTGSSFVMNPVGTTVGMATWSLTDVMPTIISMGAWSGGIAGASRIISERMPVQTQNINVNVLRAQTSKGGKTYTFGESYLQTTAKHPLATRTATGVFEFEQTNLPRIPEIRGGVGTEWPVQAYGYTRGMVTVGKSTYPVVGHYAISPRISVPTTITPTGITPATVGYRTGGFTVMQTPRGAIGTASIGEIYPITNQPTLITPTGVYKPYAELFPVQGAKVYQSIARTTAGPSAGITYVWTPPDLIEGLGGVMQGSRGVSAGGGAGALMLQSTGPVAGAGASASKLISSLASSEAISAGVATATKSVESLTSILGAGLSGASLTSSATRQKEILPTRDLTLIETATKTAQVAGQKEKILPRTTITQPEATKVDLTPIVRTSPLTKSSPISLQAPKQTLKTSPVTATKPVQIPLTMPMPIQAQLPQTKTSSKPKLGVVDIALLAVPAIIPPFPSLIEGGVKHTAKITKLNQVYKPSLLGVMFNVKVPKAPKVVTGGGIRGIVTKKKKKKKKGKKK